MRLLCDWRSNNLYLSHMNSVTGQSFKSLNQNFVIRVNQNCSMDEVRFAGATGRSKEPGRASEIRFQTQESGSGSLGQRRSHQGSSAGWLYLGLGAREGQGARERTRESRSSELYRTVRAP